MQGKVEICGVNTSKLQTLSNAEMMQLIGRSQQGDMEARSRLVEGNLKLVLSVVQRFLSRGENPDDLFQVGCIGLMKSIDHFNTELGVRFSTYAVPMNVPCGNPPIHHKRTAKTIYKGENYAILQH